MKFKELAIGNYFRFIRKNADGSDDGTVWQKVAGDRFRYGRGCESTENLAAYTYSKNETVEDLGTNYQFPELIRFKQLAKGHFFVFRDCKTVYQKLTTYYIRQCGGSQSEYYNKNGEVQDLGEEISRFL